MDTEFDSALARRLNSFVEMSKDERGILVDLQSNRITFKRGQALIEQGQTAHEAFFLQSGWGCSFKILPYGDRQVIRFPIPGDCVGLRSIVLRTSDHTVSALTDVVVAAIEAPRILEIINKFPRLGAAFLWAVARDEAMVVEHLVNIGRRTAEERMAHFFLELAERLKLIGLATETEFEHPLNQSLVADVLGLSEVHVNRVLRQLREQDLLTVREGKVSIHDLRGLRKLAGYHSADGSGQHLLPTNTG
jgi:CRP-like cAMP-binding protein